MLIIATRCLNDLAIIGKALASIEFVPVRVEQMFMRDCLQMVGFSKDFDKIEPGQIMPEYTLVIRRDRDGQYKSAVVERIKP